MNHGHWIGALPPQYLFERRRFVGIAVDTPSEEPGSWTGAGKALVDPVSGDLLLTARPRVAADGVRGYAAEIYRRTEGDRFQRVASVSKEDVARSSGISIYSIEGTQLLRDPATGRWHFYLSVDTGEGFVWGGINWETLLLTADTLEGPWESHGIVLARGKTYDANQARDSSMDIIDGTWTCLYKAMDGDRNVRPALAVSSDGISWEKLGPLTVDGEDRVAFLSGSFLPGSSGPLFVGLESSLADSRSRNDEVAYADEHGIGHGGNHTYAAGYALDQRAGDLRTIYRSYWKPGSEYEHPHYPLLGYSSIVLDPAGDRYLIFVEAIDAKLTRKIGLNETVERVLLYETRLPG